MIFKNMTDLVGRTPCVNFRPADACPARIWIKLEGFNPTGSVKDRAAIYNIRSAIEAGQLKPGKTIIDASSGNMASALAYFGMTMGFPVAVACSSKLTTEKAALIKYFGAELIRIGDFTIEASNYCRDVMVVKEPERYCFLDQLHNWNNPRAHFETTGPEILAEFPALDAVVGSLGSGGTMNGVARFIKQNRPGARVVTVEAESGTRIPGTGAFCDGDYVTPFIEQLRSAVLVDHRLSVSLESAKARTRELTRQGFYCGIQTGGVAHAAIKIAIENDLRGDVVVISGDAGWKNMDKLAEL